LRLTVDHLRRCAFFASLITAPIGSGSIRADPAGGSIALASHLAIYDLKLADSRGKRALETVQGRIVYDFSSACEGYGLKFRQVTQLNSEGKSAMSDLRATSWEDVAAKSFRFHSQNFLDEHLVEAVDGNAERQLEGVAIRLTKPEEKKFEAGQVVFPTEHMRQIIAAARAGKSLLQVSVYDGSDNGQKVYQSLTVIGRRIAPDERKPTDAAAKQSALANLDRWPVTISYFEQSNQGGEQTPAYSISFELYDNGVSRALVLDYGDFSVTGEMTSLELRDTKPCQ
jgi:hypothetical protein